MKNFLTAVGMATIVATIIFAGIAALWLGNVFLNVNQTPGIFSNTVATFEAIEAPPVNTIRLVDVSQPTQPAAAPQNFAPVVLESIPPTPTAYFAPATATPPPTRPAIEQLPQGEGPYTVEQMQICRDVWAQSLQGELTVHQFGYCQGVVKR